MAVSYEWDVEEVQDGDTIDREDEEVIDHYHQGSYADCVRLTQDAPPEGSKWRIVLVRDDANPRDIVDRSWAYLDGGKLPEWFIDADGREWAKVPKRFHKEVEKLLTSV